MLITWQVKTSCVGGSRVSTGQTRLNCFSTFQYHQMPYPRMNELRNGIRRPVTGPPCPYSGRSTGKSCPRCRCNTLSTWGRSTTNAVLSTCMSHNISRRFDDILGCQFKANMSTSINVGTCGPKNFEIHLTSKSGLPPSRVSQASGLLKRIAIWKSSLKQGPATLVSFGFWKVTLETV